MLCKDDVAPGLQAELAERDFAGERGQVIVISTGAAVDPKAEAQTAVERRAAEDRNRHRWCSALMYHAAQQNRLPPPPPGQLDPHFLSSHGGLHLMS